MSYSPTRLSLQAGHVNLKTTKYFRYKISGFLTLNEFAALNGEDHFNINTSTKISTVVKKVSLQWEKRQKN